MGYCVSIFSFIFLVVAIAAEAISFLTSYMYENKIMLMTNDHAGIFQRCLPVLGCSWWDMNTFQRDPKWLQAVVILALVSCGFLALVVLFSIISFIPRFKSRRLFLFNGSMLFINAIILATVVTVYSTLNDKNIRFTGNLVNYSWSYWLLYGAIASNLVSAVFFGCNTSKSHDRL